MKTSKTISVLSASLLASALAGSTAFAQNQNRDQRYNSSQNSYEQSYNSNNWNTRNNQRAYNNQRNEWDYGNQNQNDRYNQRANNDRWENRSSNQGYAQRNQNQQESYTSMSNDGNKGAECPGMGKDIESRDNAFRASGEITGFRTVALIDEDGVEDSFVLARIDTKKGKNMIVNLGSLQSLQDAELELGEKVCVLGRRGTIDNRNIFVADRIFNQSERQNQGMREQMRRNQEKNLQTLKGQVDGTKRVTLQADKDGRIQNHQFVRLSLEDGQQVIVGLGPDKRELRQLDINNGDYIHLKARKAMIDGKNVWMAKKIRVMNEKRNNFYRSGQQQDRTITGEVEAFRSTNIRNGNGEVEKHTLARVRLQNGQSAIVALGSDVTVRNLDITQGDRVKISGQLKSINNRKVIEAEKIMVNGEKEYSRKLS